MLANQLKIVQHRDHKQFADIMYYGLHDQCKIQKKKTIYIQ